MTKSPQEDKILTVSSTERLASPDALLAPACDWGGPLMEGRSNTLPGLLNALGVYVLVVVLFLFGTFVSRDFLTTGNLLTALQTVTLLGIVAVGVSFVTYSKHYVDLSIPGIMALSGIIAISALKWGFAASLAAGVLAGLVVGVLNGLVVGYLRLNPIIWTLAMMSVLSGIIRKAYGGRQVYPDETTAAGRAFLQLYHAEVLGLPLVVVVLVAVAVAAHFMLRKTAYGAQLKLTGSSYEVARMTGVEVRRTVAAAFVLSALTSAIAGILLTSFNKVGACYIGKGYDFAALTAVVLGGMTLAGGRGSVIGVLGGVAAIALLNNVMSLADTGALFHGIFDSVKSIAQGVVFILAVGIASYFRRRSGVDGE
ncbi:MAG: ABC transporter permease [Armatimonadetes bacterium CG_4_9_14_3_um_filter_66_14]|nr:MAG: ABC transporter permease [Armatimonadetes bacterium CG06_land_8_20_14_3_00_66_21]PIX38636.1 MAG: ABC transporter permease [Armatimonadetes bacterium CG_4_8_14_3_um_filter_66_20]PJB73356.1 MAG: ABC transporter permease [Armatimonadetes bacterium CG_4_9_14_3_um_filter_66_14]